MGPRKIDKSQKGQKNGERETQHLSKQVLGTVREVCRFW